MNDVQDLGRYDPAVLGGAIHGGKWLPPAQQFMDRNAARLRGRPVWLFNVSTLGDEDSMFRPPVAKRLRAPRKETPEIASFRAAVSAREHRNFAGAVARSHWPASGRAFFRAMGGRYGRSPQLGDRGMADRLAVQLLPAADARELKALG